MSAVVFVDRDGTIIKEPRDHQIDSLEKLEFLPGAISGLRSLIEAGFMLVMVSNQDGLGTRRFPRENFALVQEKIITLLAGEGVLFDAIFICPHTSREGCDCRKPKTGLIDEYIRKRRPDLSKSFVLGDRETDVELARNIGCRGVRLTGRNGSLADIALPGMREACNAIVRSARSAAIRRKTGETDIAATISLDGSGEYDIATGIGFFDHMLAQLARHSSIDLTLKAKGDLEIDEHHTVEDTGIVLGELIRRALGNKKGIRRFAFTAPLDEALATVTFDLSGRSFLAFRCAFTRERVGELPTELVEDFFRAFAGGLGATMHIACKGRNDHHKIEAIFKSTARALKEAVRRDAKGGLPTTKGVL